MISSQKLWPLDHEAGRLVEWHVLLKVIECPREGRLSYKIELDFVWLYLTGKILGMKLLRKYCCRCEDVIKVELHGRGCEDVTWIWLCIGPCRGALLTTVTGKNTNVTISGVDRFFWRPGRVVTIATPKRNYKLKKTDLLNFVLFFSIM